MINNHINILCLYWVGDFRGRNFVEDDVMKLHQSVDRHIDRPYIFYCLTNKMDADIPAKKIPLLHNWPGWWSKMELHRPDLPPGRTLYLDLDSHVINNLQPILDYPGDLVMFDSPTSQNKLNQWKFYYSTYGIIWRYQAATMLFDPGAVSWIYNKFCEDPVKYMSQYRSDQDVLGIWLPNQPTFPDKWMIKLGSLKNKRHSPKNVIIVTGQPHGESFRSPTFAPWLGQKARGEEKTCT